MAMRAQCVMGNLTLPSGRPAASAVMRPESASITRLNAKLQILSLR